MEYADRFRDVVETHRLDAVSREAWYAEKRNIIDLTPINDARAARANKRQRLHFGDDDGLQEAPAALFHENAALFHENALVTEDDIVEDLPINSVEANKADSKNFYEQTARHLKEHIDGGTTHELLRDTVISAGAGAAFAHQLRSVQKKASVVFAYCNMKAMVFLETCLVPIAGSSTAFICNVISKTLGVAICTTMRYLSEYTYYDALAHELPVVDGKSGVARAATITPGGQGGFHMDRRGTYDHRPNWLLHETDYKNRILRSMKRMGDKLSVDAFSVLINDFLLTIEPSTLDEHGIVLPLNRSTAYRWMLALGARRVTYVKSYYTDRHEAPDVVAYRIAYIDVVNTHIEPRLLHWVVITCDEHRAIHAQHADPTFFEEAGEYFNVDGEVWVCHHVDDAIIFADSTKYTAACNPLVPKVTEKPAIDVWVCKFNHSYDVCKCHASSLMHFGHDESVFQSGSLSACTWAVNEVVPLRSKNEGRGIMISAFQSDSLGFGSNELKQVDLDDFNVYLKNKYGAEFEALNALPTLSFFEYGKNHAGYWTGTHVANQTLRVIDLLEWLYPNHQFVFEFDHSSGHTKTADDGLCVTRLRVRFGGNVPGPPMRDSLLTENCVYPGGRAFVWQNPASLDKFSLTPVTGWSVHNCLKEAGQTQSFYFGPNDPPPYYALGTATADYVGKAKGKKQILWERGVPADIIDGMTDKGTSAEDDDTLEQGGIDDTNYPEILPGYKLGTSPELPLQTKIQHAISSKSMTKLLLSFDDFANEGSLLQNVVVGRGHILLFSPKCHPELAGAGIEYSWGKAKKYFRKINATAGAKCSVQEFHRRVTEALEGISLANCRAFSRRTRRYRAVYQQVASGAVDNVSFSLIEKMVKQHRTHRNILDQEAAFLDAHVFDEDVPADARDYDDDLIAAELGLNNRF